MPLKPYTVSFEANDLDYARLYQSHFEAFDKSYHAMDIGFTKNDVPGGFCLISFKISPGFETDDDDDGDGFIFGSQIHSNISLHATFRKAISENCQVLVYYERQDQLSIRAGGIVQLASKTS